MANRLYIAEFAGLAFTAQGDSIPAVAEAPVAEQVVNIAGTTGAVVTLGAITPGTLYTAGTYSNVPLTGGTGSGATANITAAGGAVTAVVLVNRGTGYTVADSLSASSANIGGTGSGFAVAVSTITLVSAAFQPSTNYIEMSTDQICSVAVGLNPTATVNNCRINANERLPLRGVQKGAGWQVSVITNT
jgi:hypothetical protein